MTMRSCSSVCLPAASPRAPECKRAAAAETAERQALTAAAARTPGLRRRFAKRSSKKVSPAANVRVARFRQRQTKREQMTGVEAGRDVLQPREAVNQQTSADQQD